MKQQNKTKEVLELILKQFKQTGDLNQAVDDILNILENLL